jgi:hypothetical protein
VALVTARVVEEGLVQMFSTAELRKAIDEMPDVGEVIVKAFLMRRRMLLEGVRGCHDHRLAILPGLASPPRLRGAEPRADPVDGPRLGCAG